METEKKMLDVEKLIKKSLSPESRDRICPQCNDPFHAENLGKWFCCDGCADDHYNEKVRPLKQAMKLLVEEKTKLQEMLDFKNSIPIPENVLRRNIEILDKLTIDPIAGTYYEAIAIAELGFHINTFSYREKIPGKVEDCFLLYFGRYRVTNIDNTTLKIEKLTK